MFESGEFFLQPKPLFFTIFHVHFSPQYATTMLPTLTTSRETRAYDFVPVNIIKEDSKNTFIPFSDRNFDDLSDVSLVPAGSNSRIHVSILP